MGKRRPRSTSLAPILTPESKIARASLPEPNSLAEPLLTRCPECRRWILAYVESLICHACEGVLIVDLTQSSPRPEPVERAEVTASRIIELSAAPDVAPRHAVDPIQAPKPKVAKKAKPKAGQGGLF